MIRESKVETPYAVICQEACIPKQRFLTLEFYDFQMDRPNNTWICSNCGGYANWDDENYEKYQHIIEDEGEI